jgi:two-component system chemotaxis response regulator CheY
MTSVLVVDDSEFMRKLVKSAFNDLNIPCYYVEASNGQEALEKLKTNPVNLVLLDWNMPQLSGIDFLKTVRAMEEYKNLPIIMVTSEAAKFNVIEALKQGATDYIIKPIDRKVFVEKLTKIFGVSPKT